MEAWSIQRVATTALAFSLVLFVGLVSIVLGYLDLFGATHTLVEMRQHIDEMRRDVVSYCAVWLILSGLVFFWLRRYVDTSAKVLARVMTRIADGDIAAPIPKVRGAALQQLAGALKSLLTRMEGRDRLKSQKIQELSLLVRRVIDSIEQPVLPPRCD